MKRFTLALLICLMMIPAVRADEAEHQFKLVTYNLMDVIPSQERHAAFKVVLDELKPDLLVLQRVKSNWALDTLMLLIETPLARYDSIEVAKNEFALLYNAEMWEVWGHAAYENEDRPFVLWKLSYKPMPEAPVIYLLTCRQKTGDDKAGRDARQRQVDSLKVLMAAEEGYDPNAYFILAGDVQGYKATEVGYQSLMADSFFYDPINMPGDWHDNEAFAILHTQSTHISQTGGYATGGLDDRWDQILLSKAFNAEADTAWKYVADSYKAYGNDGKRLNDSLNGPTPNELYPQAMIDALYLASDRLPVVAEIQLVIAPEGVDDQATAPARFDLLSAYPNPFNPNVQFRFSLNSSANANLSVFDVNGRLVAELINAKISAGSHSVDWNAENLSAGSYVARLTVDGKTQNLKVTYLK